MLAAILVVRIALTAVAGASDGNASTSLSLVYVTVNGESVEVAFGEGSASNTSDPISADVSFTAAEAQVGELDPITVGQVTASATPTSPSDSETGATLPLDIPDTVTGSVTFEGATAEVDVDSRYARSSFGHATLDANVGDSFVELTDVSIGNSQEVTTSTATASEDVEIGNLSLVPLREILDRVTNISPDDLIALAGAIGGAHTDDELALVEAERQEAIDEINGLLGPFGVSPLPDDASVQTILDYADSCASTVPALALPLCAAVASAITDLEAAVDDLNDAVGDLPLISVTALQAGVSSEAFDTTATATAGVTWESAQVAGIDLFDVVDPDAAMTALVEAVELVEAELEKIPGLEGVEIDVTRLFLDTATGPVGDSHRGSSSLNFLNVQLNVPESGLVPAPLTAEINVLAMGSGAQHEPAPVEEEPPPVCPGDPSCPPPDPICPGDPSCPPPPDTENNPPVAVDDSATTPPNMPVDISVLPNDSDPDEDTITVVSFTQPSNGTVSCTSAGICTYTPNDGFSGTDTFTYTISDPFGLTSTATVTITVPAPPTEPPDPENNPPVAVDDSATTPQNMPVDISVLPNDSDPDGDAIEVISKTDPSNGTVVCTKDGICTYTPNLGFSGTDTFTYTIWDIPGHGTSTATVTITVPAPPTEPPPPGNNPPVAVDDSATTPQNMPVDISVLPNDSDPDDDAIVVVSFTQPSNGTVSCTSGGVCTYTPNDGFSGTDTFTYTIADPSGETSTATVTITVPAPPPPPPPTNNPPVAVDDSGTTPPETPVEISVLPNDSDPDGDDIAVISYTQPSNGTVTCTGSGTCIYTPDDGFSGTDTFTYTISDPSGGTSTATVTVTVPSSPPPDPTCPGDPSCPPPDPDNQPPVAVDDSATAEPNTPVEISVLPNDSDPDGDDISVVSNTQPSDGTVVCTSSGTCIYTPDEGFSGTDTFDYTIAEPSGATSTATVTITVPGAPVPPDPDDPSSPSDPGPGPGDTEVGDVINRNQGESSTDQTVSTPSNTTSLTGDPTGSSVNTPRSGSSCTNGCGLARTGLDLRFGVLAIYLIIGGFTVCRFSRKVA